MSGPLVVAGTALGHNIYSFESKCIYMYKYFTAMLQYEAICLSYTLIFPIYGVNL